MKRCSLWRKLVGHIRKHTCKTMRAWIYKGKPRRLRSRLVHAFRGKSSMLFVRNTTEQEKRAKRAVWRWPLPIQLPRALLRSHMIPRSLQYEENLKILKQWRGYKKTWVLAALHLRQICLKGICFVPCNVLYLSMFCYVSSTNFNVPLGERCHAKSTWQILVLVFLLQNPTDITISKMLGYVINAPLHEHKGAQWHNGRCGNPNMAPRETSPSQGCPMAAITVSYGGYCLQE